MNSAEPLNVNPSTPSGSDQQPAGWKLPAGQLHRVIQLGEQFGWPQELPPDLINQIGSLLHGLPAEDHFIAVVRWLGFCELAHKLEPEAVPVLHDRNVQVPDLLICFKRDNQRRRVAVEVKRTQENKRVWSKKYLNGLEEYGQIVGMPVLTATYWDQFNIWTLNDVSSFSLRKQSFHLDFKNAMRESLMGELAGDFLYSLQNNAGIHVVLEADDEINVTKEQPTQTVILTVRDLYIQDTNGERVQTDDGLLFLFLIHTPVPEYERIESRTIYFGCQAEDTESYLAQQSVFALKVNQTETWAQIAHSLARQRYRMPFIDLAKVGLPLGITHFVGALQPQRFPTWW